MGPGRCENPHADLFKMDGEVRRGASAQGKELGDLLGEKIQDYLLESKLGSGSFGDIYLAKHCVTGEEVAVKVEQASTEHPQLSHEYKVYRHLRSNDSLGFPNVHYYGEDERYNIMVMEKLGSNLEELFNLCNRKFSLKTILMLADQMLHRIEYVHGKLMLHRDIKPENFMMGVGNYDQYVHLIDFGLSRKYRSGRTGRHILLKSNCSLTGTARYASVNAHQGIEQTRRDDMESLGFLLMYFIKGKLPWQGLKAGNRAEKYNRISEVKIGTTIDELCKGYPQEFSMYLNYCRSLRFDEKPDYAHLRRVFRKLFTINQLRFDYIYDWTPILNGKVSSSVPRPISFSERNQIRGSNVQNFHAKTHSTFIDTKKSSSKDIKAEAKFDDEEFNTRKDIKKNSKVFLARGNKISNEAKPKWSGIFNDEDDIIDEIKKISMNK